MPASHRQLPVEQLTLDNGLRVTLQADPTAPLVTVNIWYHVGSKNERPGRTGFAHLFEHMLFQGSKNVDANQHFALIQERGGSTNGSTWFDRTNYYETLPSSELELALWLESDRMGFFLEGLNQEKLDTQREVVKNERRQRIDNQPYGTWLERAQALVFPPTHPYHWPVIGYMEDLEAADLDDVSEFFKTYYVPRNAVLTIVGDIDPQAAADQVRRYFAEIPMGAAVPAVDARLAPLSRERRETIEEDVQLPRSYAVYPIPAFGTSGFNELDLASDLLGSGKTSRLYRKLVYEDRLAQDVAAATFGTEEVGLFIVMSTARPGVELERLEAAIDDELRRAVTAPPSEAEMTRLHNRAEAAALGRLESIESRADRLSMHATYAGDPEGAFRELDGYHAVDSEQIADAASSYLTPSKRAVVRFVPARKSTSESVVTPLPRDRAPGRGTPRPYSFPRPSRTTLVNGVKIVTSRLDRIPLITAVALRDAGVARDPRGRSGLATLTARTLTEGTTAHSSTELADALELLGASVGSAADVDSARLSFESLARNIDQTFALTAEVLRDATFPDGEVDRLKQEQLTRILQTRDDPASLASQTVERLLYGEHPYGNLRNGLSPEVESLQREDVRAFAERYSQPAGTTLIVCGAIEHERVVELAERHLASWRTSSETIPALEPAPADQPLKLYLIDKPRAAQSELRLANIAMTCASDDYVPAKVMNGILGGKFTSRINLNLREDHGYTYGARTGFESRRVAAPFVVSTAVHTEVTVPALEELFKELRRIRDEPVSEQELDETRNYLTGVFPLTVETSKAVLQRLAQIELFGLPDDYFDRYVERVAATTIDDIQRVAKLYVKPEQMTVLVVGDAAAIRHDLARLGELSEIE